MTNQKYLDVLNKKVGSKLSNVEQKHYWKVIGEFIDTIGARRRYILYTHNSIQNRLAGWMEYIGWKATLEAAFHSGGFSKDQVRFDLVAEKGKSMLIFEVKDTITTRDLGQVHGYANILQAQKIKATVYLATDILNYSDCIDGVTGEQVKELMEREKIGVVFLDERILIFCDNYKQLSGEEMPEIIIYDEE